MNTITTRKHPAYRAAEAAWKRSCEAYSGGREYIEQALIKHMSEIDMEFIERQNRAFYFNYPRAIAQRITQYALSVDPVRDNANPELVEDWSRTGLRTNEVMRQLSTLLTVYGRAWLLVDTPAFDGPADLERAQRERLRPFVTALPPLEVVDWAYGSDGLLQWALIEEVSCFDADPFADRQLIRRRRLYTRDFWRVYELSGAGAGGVVAEGVNTIGKVPLVAVVENDGYGLAARHWFEDVVRISDAILNNESEAQMNTVKQMFGMLVISESFAGTARDNIGQTNKADNFAVAVARSAAITEGTNEKGISRYISPSGAETATIRTENAALKQELYDVVGLAIQSRSKEAQTAESKAWDFQNVSQFLAGRADLLEQAELRAWDIINLLDPSIPVPAVTYNRKFAVRDLAQNIQGLLQLSNMPGAGVEYRKTIMSAAVELVEAICAIPDKQKKALLGEIDRMKEEPESEFYKPVDNSDNV